MSIYSKKLLGPQTLSTVSTVYYTVPAGKVAVIRSVVLCNPSTTDARNVTILITRAGVQRTFYTAIVPLFSTPVIDMRIPMVAGDQISANSVSNGLSLTIGGYEFDA